jgi:hypothetical protein
MYVVADLIRTNWNTIIPYMEQIAAFMQEQLDESDIHSMTKRLALLVPTTF